jgi:hypothetical protein
MQHPLDLQRRSFIVDQSPRPPVTFDLAVTGLTNQGVEPGQADDLISDSDFAARLNATLSNTDARSAQTRQTLISRWTEVNPVAAANWVAGLSPGPVYQHALQQVVTGWSETNLVAARQWLMARPDDDSRSAALISLGYEAARVDPVMSLEVAGRLSSTPERDNLIVHATSQWASMDLQSALSWACQVTDQLLRQRLISSIATATAKLDGAAAAMMVAQLMRPGDEQNRAAVSVVQRWAQIAPQAAADWVAEYPDGPVRAAALASLASIQAAQQSN